MGNWVQAWIRGDVDWDGMRESFSTWAPIFSGALFGAGEQRTSIRFAGGLKSWYINQA
jgi:hypothetical protein